MSVDTAMTSENPEQLTLQYVQNRAQMLFFILGANGQIIEANQAARSMTGRELTAENFAEIIIDFSGTFDLKALANAPDKEHLLNIPTRAGLPQSFYFFFEAMGDRYIAFGRLDAEEIQSMQQEILSLNRDLNSLTRQLHKKNAQLKQLNDEKNRFLGMAAHDLRKPIGLIITYSEFLIEEAAGGLSEEHQGFLNTIHSSCGFMKRLVDDFLDVSAIEAGRFELDRQAENIGEVLERSLALNRLQADKKGIDLTVECQDPLPRLTIDGPKIEQVITNLVSNAIEHTEPDTAVSIGLIVNPASIRFSVRDAGPGIAPEEMDKLFQPFEKTSTKKIAGPKSTGLGMVISRKIIEAHGGSIWVESKLGGGTTVSFDLPMNEENN